MATPGKATKKEKKKPVPVKTSLNNPYDLKWKPLEKGHARFILKTVTEKFDSLELRKRHVKVFRKWRSKRKAKKGNSDSVNTNEPTPESRDSAEPTPESRDSAEPTPESRERGWTDNHLRHELAIGINEVTKGLEKNELALVLVCDSVRPAHMTSHLISLSQTRSVPACQVPGLSASLARSLGLTSVLALGFKRQSGAFADTIAALAPKVPPLGVAWVPTGTGECEPEVVQVSGETEQQLEEEEPGRGRKRKLEESPEVKKDPVPLLQPLKVKKIIPNPSKIRKLKIKKAKK
ncbi:ribonuclease P protein subunit p38 [Pangasianodon hypophthalmus]|uniref:ribonuclease P protein subunit p38 n=1 Tax=Pangasianodon hypophthalmus TaxID=310915 RepID=UPI0023070346|nr:ribonuclease P protein subunit p38 [Pangasianodon hypophthalmus]